MKKLFLSLGLATLLFCLGCGSNNSSGPTPMGNYTLASVSGQYTYQLSGFDLNTGNPYTRAGVFTADGAGGISGGTDDFTEGSLSTSTISGTYSLSNDGTGFLTLNFPSGSAQWVFTLQSSSKMYLIETSSDAAGNPTPFSGYGAAELQNSAAFAGAPSGTFVFRNHISAIGASSVTPVSSVGAMTIAGGVGTGNEDVNALGVGLTPLAITSASFNAPDATGRGSGTFTDSSLTTTVFEYYVVDANNIRILITTPGSVGLGRAELQTGTGTFTNASFSGSYAYGLRGDTVNNLSGAHTVGRFTADGNGGITAGVLDAQVDGQLTSNASYTGSYATTSNGRTALTLNIGSGTAQQVYWLINPSRAFFLVNDPNKATEGTADLQTVSSFSNATVTGQFAFVNNGVTVVPNQGITSTVDRVATLQWSGSGGLQLNEFINVTGSTSVPGFLSGTYSTSSNGRTTATISGTANNINFVFYLFSGAQGYVLQTDSTYEVDGTTQLQQ